MLKACYWNSMANLQVKNVPEPIHRKIRAFAERRGRTVRDFVLSAVLREIEREEFRARLAKRTPVDLGRPAARTLEELRAERDERLSR
jgi:plasmid stability protein